VTKTGPRDVVFTQASKANQHKQEINKDRLLNVICNQGQYYVFQPSDPSVHFTQGASSIIDNYLWLIAKYMPGKELKIDQDCVIRFGRIPFKVSKLQLPDKMLLSEEEDSLSEESKSS